ncbi:toxin-antitoxin system antitoxin subunit [Adlercreutzia sp. ZJ242]|uniref:toxin-antitoxin system antitoxin subunit n=1 Tax=Adlercreutzia sp. ZJ242 TaxID=2709409 RepID=UPI0013EBCC15|nr:toxin-antitoxin system antitoxin subunit [Adlercreutzia sp. ZJ242]
MSNEELRERFGVTAEQLDAWADEYESADWSHMRFGEVINGRPRVSDEPLDSITVKIPRSRTVAMKRVQQETGMTRSEFVRRAIDHELMALS